MIGIPLVIASVVRGLAASENLEQLRKMGIRVTMFFVVTTAIAATIGLWVGGLINPGNMMTGLTTPPAGAAPATPNLLGIAAIPVTLMVLLVCNPLDANVDENMSQVGTYCQQVTGVLVRVS